ncbi:MAG: group II intron maturase-specific domain-containing protein [Acidimicrobiales bacterium]
MTPTSPVRPLVPCRCRCRSSPPGSGSWSRPAAPGTAPGGPACASNRTPPASGPRTDAHAARSWPRPGGPGRGQCVAYSFDEISHTALLQRVRDRIGDKRVVGLVKAFLKAGILSEDGVERDTITGTPQGGILSPLLSNIALSVLDDHFAGRWEKDRVARAKRRRHGLPNYRLVRYADDFVVMVFGTQAHAEATRDEVAAVLAPMGLRLSEEKTRIAHIDKGFDFLGWRIQRHQKRGGTKRYVYTYPAKKALASIVERVRTITRQGTDLSLTVLLHRLNPVLRGWTTYFRPGVSHRTFQYLRAYTWHRVVGWLRRKHPRLNWEQLRRRHLPGWWPTEGEVRLFNPGAVTTTRYRYRGAAIPSPWTSATPGTAA